MKPSDYPILDLIPQRPPMQMIDKLLEADEKSARGSLYISESNLFVVNGRLSETALIEFIAQTAAAFTGFGAKINNRNVEEGYIGAVKNLIIHERPPVGCEINSVIEVTNQIIGFTIINGCVYLQNRLIAECEMRILSRQ